MHRQEFCSGQTMLHEPRWSYRPTFPMFHFSMNLADHIPASIQAKCNACFNFPCSNGASCIARPDRDYICFCSPGYHGRHCEQVIDACYGQPCINHGTCKVLEEGRFRYTKTAKWHTSGILKLNYGIYSLLQLHVS